MNRAETAGPIVGACSLPDHFVAKVPRAKHGIHESFEIVARGGVAMQVDTSRRLEHALALGQAFRHVGQIRQHAALAQHLVQPFYSLMSWMGGGAAQGRIPFRSGGVPGPGVFKRAHLGRNAVVGSKELVVGSVRIERGVQVNQVDGARMPAPASPPSSLRNRDCLGSRREFRLSFVIQVAGAADCSYEIVLIIFCVPRINSLS